METPARQEPWNRWIGTGKRSVRAHSPTRADVLCFCAAKMPTERLRSGRSTARCSRSQSTGPMTQDAESGRVRGLPLRQVVVTTRSI